MSTARVTLAAIQQARTRRQYCHLGPQIATLSRAERRDYEAALADRSIPIPAIEAVLRRRGLRVNVTTLQEHRNGRCGNCFGAAR